MNWASRALNAIAAICVVAMAVAISSSGRAHADNLSDALAALPAHVAINHSGLAASGYDVVAFVMQGVALKGRRTITADHEGATYRFADAANREIFLTDPDALVPQFGGYGAYGVRAGRKLQPDRPLAWQVHGDKLYFFVDEETRSLWNADAEANMRIAKMIWEKIRTVPPALLVDPAIN